jgi:hypothetical protein
MENGFWQDVCEDFSLNRQGSQSIRHRKGQASLFHAIHFAGVLGPSSVALPYNHQKSRASTLQ